MLEVVKTKSTFSQFPYICITKLRTMPFILHKKTILLVLLPFTSTTFLHARLSGYYTIGGQNATYSTIDAAIDDMNVRGVDGLVVFVIRAGIYSAFSINNNTIDILNDSVVFQSESLDSNSVLINGKVTLNNASRITFKALTFQETGSSTSVAVEIVKCNQVNFYNCLFNTPNSSGSYYDRHSAITISNNFDPPYNSVSMDQCRFSGKGCGIYIRGYKGINTINRCTLASTGRYSLYFNWLENLTITNCVITGDIDCGWVNGIEFSNNIVTSKNIELESFKTIENNDFNSIQNYSITVKGDLIKNNIFRQNTSVNGKSVVSNQFKGDADLSRTNYLLFQKNIVNNNLKLTFCNSTHITGNRIYGQTYLSFADKTVVDNNIFYKSISTGLSNYNSFYHNNFIGDATLSISNSGNEIVNNNFNRECECYGENILKYNNYYPGTSKLDKFPFHFDPQYLNDSLARSRNPLLIGKGAQISSITTDFDDKNRPLQPTIGAHEICTNSFTSYDTIELICGNSIQLLRCDIKDLSNYRWLPNIDLSDSNSNSPTASPKVSRTYYLMNTNREAIDSVFIQVANFKVQGLDSIYIEECGYEAQISKNFNPIATYTWTPRDYLYFPEFYNPKVKPRDAQMYIQHIVIPGCGEFTDSTYVNLNPLPKANYASYTTQDLEVTFEGYTLCQDNIQWDFGDGTTDTDPYPVHTYTSEGDYDCQLIAYNHYGSDTFFFTVSVHKTDINILQSEKFDLYPNPNNGAFQLSYPKTIEITSLKLLNIQGQAIQTLDPLQSEFTLDAGFVPGIYILEITTNSGIVYLRMVVS